MSDSPNGIAFPRFHGSTQRARITFPDMTGWLSELWFASAEDHRERLQAADPEFSQSSQSPAQLCPCFLLRGEIPKYLIRNINN